jgi:hypothetical protein
MVRRSRRLRNREASRNREEVQAIVPEIPESVQAALEFATQKLQNILDGCDRPWKKVALISTLVVLIILVIIGAICLFTYISHGELIHIPWGNDGKGFHWPDNTHGLVDYLKTRV